ncbi:MAG: EFR1 family ferrodoxin [Prevotellaceae bacterium]|nr:EFR1 family ferrodoxin [Prevotellaceae bacterium]MDO4932464.1 EFR1 family ferrodoxin [Prevotellaceae bacterium]
MEEDRKITRRSALKRMGLAITGAAVASSGLLSLTSCGKGKARRIMLYFTGTGNCLYVARQLGGADAELLSIPQLVKKGGSVEIEADEIGIVYPIYGHMPPNMVRQFIRKARLKADYLFAVLTYGNRKCNAVEIWDDISRSAGKRFDYISTLIMVDNWLPNFDMNEQVLIDKHIPENLRKITADLAEKKRWHEAVTEEERQQHQEFMQRTGMDAEKGFALRSEDYFTVTEACIGCGVCVSVCPHGDYELAPQGVRMQGDCEFCFACIQNCPQKAIQFLKNEKDPLLRNGEKNPNARYRNEHVSLMDIKMANSQF